MFRVNYIIVILVFLFPLILAAQEGYTEKTFDHFDNLWMQKWLGSDDKLDSLKVYHRNGQLNEVFYFNEDDKIHGEAKKFTYKNRLYTKWNFINGNLENEEFHTVKHNDSLKKFISKIEDYSIETEERLKSAVANKSRARLSHVYLPLSYFENEVEI